MTKSKGMRWTCHEGCIRKQRGVYWVLVGKPDRKRTHGRLRHRT